MATALTIAVVATASAQATDNLDELVGSAQRLRESGKAAQALPISKRALEIVQRQYGSEHLFTGRVSSQLTGILIDLGRYKDAEPYARRTVQILTKAEGNSEGAGNASNTLAFVLLALNKYDEAATHAKRAVAAMERFQGSNSDAVANTLNTLASIYDKSERYDEAEPIVKRAVSIREKVNGPNSEAYANGLGLLVSILMRQGRASEAEPIARRALAIIEKNTGKDSAATANAMNTLCTVLIDLGKYAPAEPFARRVVATWEKQFGATSDQAGNGHNTLAAVYDGMGRRKEAIEEAQRALEIWAKIQGVRSHGVAVGYNNLGYKQLGVGDPISAEVSFSKTLEFAQAENPESLLTATALSGLAESHFSRSNWEVARDLYQRQLDILISRAKRDMPSVGRKLAGKKQSEIARASVALMHYIKATFYTAESEIDDNGALVDAAFYMAQWRANTASSEALMLTAARNAKKGSALGAIVRERQDLVGQWDELDKARIASVSLAQDKSDAKSKASNTSRLADIDARIARIDRRLANEFPDYSALSNPLPLSVSGAQEVLQENETLVLIFDTPAMKPTLEETFVWFVPKTGAAKWHRSEIRGLADKVQKLRCGLDRTEWDKSDRCQQLLGAAAPNKNVPLPFDTGLAHELYEALFGEAKDLIQGKHLLLVPSGPLTSLPFQILLTEVPKAEARLNYGDMAWLAKSNAVTVLPSVGSLAALRRASAVAVRMTDNREPFIGFGDPVLPQHDYCGEIEIPDKCPEDEVEVAHANSARSTRAPGDKSALRGLFRNGLADVAAVKAAFCPLPDTAHELKCVASSLGANPKDIFLGKEMTESALKKMQLDRYRVLHFATHGLLAGETAELAQLKAEPALLLTPPQMPSEEDDGLLTASEVAGLKLDADWVVMSACNTAGGGAPGAEAFSGLARAFFYAGAKALLVSHWPVDSYAATMITSRLFVEMRNDPKIGRTEAFRRAMLSLMSDPKRAWAAHPSVWAPFVVVGEGGAGAQ